MGKKQNVCKIKYKTHCHFSELSLWKSLVFFFNLSIALLTYSLGAISYVAYFSLGSLDFDGKPRDKVTQGNAISSNFVRLFSTTSPYGTWS